MANRILLNTIGRVSSELGRIYRLGKRGQMPWQDAVAAAKILREIRHCLESSVIEQRLTELEQRAEMAALQGVKPQQAPHYYRQ